MPYELAQVVASLNIRQVTECACSYRPFAASQYRGWKTTVLQIGAPVGFLILLLIIQELPHDGKYTGMNSLRSRAVPKRAPPC